LEETSDEAERPLTFTGVVTVDVHNKKYVLEQGLGFFLGDDLENT